MARTPPCASPASCPCARTGRWAADPAAVSFPLYLSPSPVPSTGLAPAVIAAGAFLLGPAVVQPVARREWGRTLQRLWAVLPGGALPAGDAGVTAPQGGLHGPALERCRPALLVWHGGRPRWCHRPVPSLGCARTVCAGPALDCIGRGLRCNPA